MSTTKIRPSSDGQKGYLQHASGGILVIVGLLLPAELPSAEPVLFDGSDKQLHATLEGDFLKLWTEDVFECFFWPNEEKPPYFEYEISPLGYELPLLLPKSDGRYFGWIPWPYEGERKTRKQISIRGGEQKSMAAIDGWSAAC
ncbi:MAG: hypothetical protein KDA72_16075 [Planctomycetales bacterium]|nr:hypothetical protein [Planctomycetales bacterium]